MTQTELLDTIRKEVGRRIKFHYKEGIRVNTDRIDEDEIILAFLYTLNSFADELQEPEVGLENEIERRIMKDYPYVPGWRQNKENNKPAIKRSVLMFTTHGVAEGEWDGEQWVQYRWSCKVKDSDVLYWLHLADLQTLEKEGESVQEPEVDGLEEEIREYMSNEDNNPFDWDWRDKRDCARHFAEWGAKNAK